MKRLPHPLKTIFLGIIALTSFSRLAFSQSTEALGCQAWEEHLKQYSIDANYVKGFNTAEIKAQKWLEKNGNVSMYKNGKIVIPVVVHVVYNNATPEDSALQYLPAARIQEQIDILNNAFSDNVDKSSRRPIFDSVAADMQIEFKLACIDTLGNPTTGIEYIATDVTDWDIYGGTFLSSSPNYTDIKRTSKGGINAWDTEKYFNMWTGNLSVLGSEGLYGVATFPFAMPTAEGRDAAQNPNEIGVIVHYAKFGVNSERQLENGSDYSIGYTLVHEVGHFFGLRHIWGDEQRGGFGSNDPLCSKDDYVYDTPVSANQGDISGGNCVYTDECALAAENNFSNGYWKGVNPPDMIENYMHYTSEACQNILTKGQKRRMWSFLYTSYPFFLTSSGACQPQDFQAVTDGQPVECNNVCDGDLTVRARNGVAPYQFSLDGGSTFQTDSLFTDLCVGDYDVVVKDANDVLLQFPAEVYSNYGTPYVKAVVTNTTCGACTDGEVTLDITYGEPGFTVNWSNGATGATLTGVTAGTYTATITDACGIDHSYTYDVGGVGIKTNAKIAASIYPNPAKSFIKVVANNPITSIRVLQINGQEVLNIPASNSEVTVSLTGISKGIYLVEIETSLGKYVAKQIVE